MIAWSLGGKDGLTLVLSPQTTADYRVEAKVRKEVHSDARVLAGLKRRPIDVQGSDGSVLATVQMLGDDK